MKEREVWDAVDVNGKKLGFDLYRDEIGYGKGEVPEGVYHAVAEIYVVTKNREFLCTQRDPRKPFGLKWEITGGSVLKGETPADGAVRELREETGIVVRPEDMTLLCMMPSGRTLYYIYAVTIPDSAVQVTLQPGETVDCRFLTREEFMREVDTERFAGTIGKRLTQHKMQLEDYLDSVK